MKPSLVLVDSFVDGDAFLSLFTTVSVANLLDDYDSVIKCMFIQTNNINVTYVFDGFVIRRRINKHFLRVSVRRSRVARITV